MFKKEHFNRVKKISVDKRCQTFFDERYSIKATKKVTYYRGNDLRPSAGIVLKNVWKSMVRTLDINDLSTHNRHVDQMQLQEPDNTEVLST
ncbi:unnamed protein product [Schistosoma margrebowiei]|uniref:Uncharacterized protein n=1 Tax=Schistosoma margrebowiei TaxID=48269 RepID=A0AA85AIU9_9TREM|nr:unnamed protein product [Schistosoma margrebowiei]